MPTLMVTSSEVDASKFVGGEIIYHTDRQHYYQIINRCSGKGPNGWLEGWTYVRVKDLFGNQTAFEVDCDPDKFKMYFRPDESFDSDWSLIRAVIL
ncbi:gp29 [Erwinia phage vB_EamM-Y2]|uniref:Gp29 n=1 Tax=Erwinia phage vB_EamM-Y2 TaxID=1051676 RepID=G0YPX8_9CAUD|nr:gp29 [Erwinia phage vB_EamM-Y2]AEJ81405.1 gp29 [Erwinia phage vB_EamM-Y2]